MPSGELSCWWTIKRRGIGRSRYAPAPCGKEAKEYTVNGWLKLILCKKHALCTWGKKTVQYMTAEGVDWKRGETNGGVQACV